nr:hypothetical protein [Tanacetum cinerariifolium]
MQFERERIDAVVTQSIHKSIESTTTLIEIRSQDIPRIRQVSRGNNNLYIYIMKRTTSIITSAEVITIIISIIKPGVVINEDDTTDDEDVFTSYGVSLGGGNQLEDEDFDFYESYVDQVVDLDGALKEFRDFKLSMSDRK